MEERKGHLYWSCEKKVDYKTWEAAEAGALDVIDNGQWTTKSGKRQVVMAYKCMYQAHWHIGHNPRVTFALFDSPARGNRFRRYLKQINEIPDTSNVRTDLSGSSTPSS